ncbi:MULTISPECIES: diacylglycerol kinase family protein [unclassified Streptomyces]|uniref:diacylglycerol/lipid kinase family protein n=1 Tax=unclassified Streptomyces TaxID=2593676 RepID=UPI0013EB4C82|nr:MULTISPECIES: diacylglycerol kinase family protein [unclassified Streptomyces]WKX17207.1 diacylglycerol kinase family protein [Streptomyces sp. HUAS CX7]
MATGLRSVLWALFGSAGLALAAIGVWWALAHSGVVRVAGALLSVATPVAVLALYATAGMLGPALLSLGLLALALIAARWTLAPAFTTGEQVAAAPDRPWVLVNRRSGGGKADRFALVDKARNAGCRVHVLDRDQDVTTLARQAIADGADLLGVAGGDGTQALVADVAARHHVPFAVIPAGTRNHFALDLGLDRDDPVAALEALTGGTELRVDLGYAADRVFVNNASFGTYASVLDDSAYRGAKIRTILQNLPGLLTGEAAPALRMTADGRRITGLQAVLVSNNSYGRAIDVAHPARRERLDTGLLGVVCVRVGSAAEAARLASRPRSGGLIRLSAGEVTVETDTDTMPVGIDGEHVVLPCPVVCRSAPRALRVRVPHHRPGRPKPRGAVVDWPRVTRLALGRPLLCLEEPGPRRRDRRRNCRGGRRAFSSAVHAPNEERSEMERHLMTRPDKDMTHRSLLSRPAVCRLVPFALITAVALVFEPFERRDPPPHSHGDDAPDCPSVDTHARPCKARSVVLPLPLARVRVRKTV